MEGLNVFVIFILAAVAVAEVAKFQACPNTPGNCKIHEVRVNPCPEAETSEPCKIKRGNSAEIQFDYSADFNSPTIEGRAYWASEIDLPLIGMDTDGCKFSKCPVVQNERQSYNFTLAISRKFPAGLYDVKWRVTGTSPDQECCFITTIKLVR